MFRLGRFCKRLGALRESASGGSPNLLSPARWVMKYNLTGNPDEEIQSHLPEGVCKVPFLMGIPTLAGPDNREISPPFGCYWLY